MEYLQIPGAVEGVKAGVKRMPALAYRALQLRSLKLERDERAKHPESLMIDDWDAMIGWADDVLSACLCEIVGMDAPVATAEDALELARGLPIGSQLLLAYAAMGVQGLPAKFRAAPSDPGVVEGG